RASRASQDGGAGERPLSERSEFGPRAPLSEKRRGPDRLHRSGSRPATAVLVTFAKTKVTRASARKLLILILILPFSFCFRSPPVTCQKRKARGQIKSVSRAGRASHLSLACAKKPGAKKHTPPPRPALRTGSAEPAGFSEGASCPCGKRRTSCAAPCGSDPPAPPL